MDDKKIIILLLRYLLSKTRIPAKMAYYSTSLLILTWLQSMVGNLVNRSKTWQEVIEELNFWIDQTNGYLPMLSLLC